MKTAGSTGRGAGCTDPLPYPRRPLGRNFPKPARPRSTSPFPPLDEREAKTVLTPSETYRASLAKAPRRKADKPPKQPPPPNFDEEKALRMLKEGHLRKRIAEELGISPETLRRFARRKGIPSTKAPTLHPHIKPLNPEMLKDALDGMSANALSEKYDIARSTVLKQLDRAGYFYDPVKRRTYKRDDQ